MDAPLFKRLFGTDGIRGRANQWPIVPELIVKIGRATAHFFQNQNTFDHLTRPAKQKSASLNSCYTYHPYIQDLLGDHPFTVIIGKDTRLSGYMIESALAAGLVAQGAHVIMLGPVPTPAVAMLVRSLRADIGIMISASHNPYQDNGIKFFDRNGIKFREDVERAIERIVEEDAIPLAENCGKSMRLDDAAGRYVEFAKTTFHKKRSLAGMKIVVDCANGATYKVAPRIFWELGASVSIIGETPNGRNINFQCGALFPEALLKRVKEEKADIGIALDGDGDRVLIATPNETIVNGDQILALIAKNWQQKGILKRGVVSTCMSNLGLKKYLASQKIPWFTSSVGDKNVLECMEREFCNLGGEESGHIILNDTITTGDGIIAALQVVEIFLEYGQNLDRIFPVFLPVPQITRSFKISSKLSVGKIEQIKQEAQAFLMDEGDVIIRSSGTEPVLRVMVQGEDPSRVQKVFDTIIEPSLDVAS